MGAVSPAARDTCRITPVRMPLSELGSTMVRIVCQRNAPRFQQASRKAMGTAARASRVLVIITGKVITARVQEAASIERPMPAKSTNAPTPNKRMHDAGHPGQIDHAQIDDPREPVVGGIFVEIDAGQDAHGRRHRQRDEHQEEGSHQRRPDAAGGHVVAGVIQQERQPQAPARP